jgi:DNA-binding CsgD family transcriptional regulator
MSLPSSTNLQNAIASIPFSALLDGLVDGLLVANTCGKLVHANDRGRQFCQQLCGYRDRLPDAIWQVCQQHLNRTAETSFIFESEIASCQQTPLRLRVCLWEWDDCPHFLVTLEDRQQSLQQLAIADSQKYNFTPREAQVWQLRRAQLSYQQIAERLYISQNTVKKHMKNINAKRQAALWAETDDHLDAPKFR